MSRLVLGVDVETTGLDETEDEIIEVGAVLWDVDEHTPVGVMSETVIYEGILSENTKKLTGITEDMLMAPLAKPLSEVMNRVSELAVLAEFYVAHNAPFDRKFLEAGAVKGHAKWHDLPWIDTQRDIIYPEHIKILQLKHLCAEHEFLNPFAHRAAFDVLSMLKVMSHYDFQDIAEISQIPYVRVVAHVSFEEKDLAKNVGFMWDPGKKQWFKEMKQTFYDPTGFEFPTSCREVT